MHKDYEKLFSRLSPPDSPEGLFGKIMNRIDEEKKLLAVKRRFAIFSVGFVGSLAAFIPVLKMTQAAFVNSGFLDFFSLIISDSKIMMTYWQNFLLTLLESLPVVNIIVFLATIFTLLISLKFLARDIKIVFAATRLTRI